MHMCVGGSVLNVSAYVFLHVHTHVESMSRISVNHSPPYFLRQYLSLILQLTDSAKLAFQQAWVIHLCLPLLH